MPPISRRHMILNHPPTQRHIDLRRAPADRVEAQALRTAFELNSMSRFDVDGDPTRLDWREWQAAMLDPGVYPQAKRLLWRLHPNFFNTDTDTAPPKLSPGTGALLQSKLDNAALDPQAKQLLQQLTALPGFGRLVEDEQLRALRLLGSTLTSLAEPARQAFAELMMRPDFASGDWATQARELRDLLTKQSWLDDYSSGPDKLKGSQVRPHTIQGPTEVASRHFRLDEKDAPALRYDVVFEDGHQVAVYLPKNIDPEYAPYCPSVEEYATAIASLPPRWAPLLTELNVAHSVPPEGGFMGVDSGSGVWALPVAKGEQQALNHSMAHEVGHLLTMSGWNITSWDENAPEYAPWRAAQQKDVLSPTGYARTLVADDAAEMLAYYAMTRGTSLEAELRELFPARMALIDDLETRLFADL